MTGYLQRLVSSAMNPAPRVHPVLAPMFSTPQYQAQDESIPEEAISSTTPFQKAVASMDEGEPLGIQTDASEGATKPIAVESVLSIPEKTSADRRPAQAARGQGEQSPARIKATRPVGKKEASRTYSEHIPLLPEVSALPLSIQNDSPPIQPHRPGPQERREDSNRTRITSTTKPVPDEIQITIGRIEVTAVPEAHPRPAVKPPRKHLSLDEYLKRADARRR